MVDGRNVERRSLPLPPAGRLVAVVDHAGTVVEWYETIRAAARAIDRADARHTRWCITYGQRGDAVHRSIIDLRNQPTREIKRIHPESPAWVRA